MLVTPSALARARIGRAAGRGAGRSTLSRAGPEAVEADCLKHIPDLGTKLELG